MRNFFNFNKNAGALALLLCCFFFNLGVGMAQTGQWEIPIENNKKIIVIPDDKISGACADPVGYSGIIPNSYYFMVNGCAAKLIDSAFTKTPVSKYFKVNCWDFFSYKLLIPNNGLSPTYDVSYRVNGEGVPPSSLNWEWSVDCNVDDLGTQTIDGVSYTVKRIHGRIVGGTTRAWHMIELKKTSTPNVVRCIVLPIVSVGQLFLDQQVPVLGTTVQPQIPYMVLHAPPGDGSSSEFQETKTTCREYSDTYAEDGSNSANLAVKLGVAGSIGFIATVDLEFSVTFSAGITAGDLAVTTKSNQTCVTASQGFSTNALLGGNGGGDVFIGYGTDLSYGLYPLVRINPNTCIAKIDTGLIYAPSGNPRKFVYTEEAIQADIINQKAKAANQALSVRDRNIAQNQVDVWEKVLAQNNANKSNPNNALIENLSFSAGANTSQESSITVLETNSLEVEHYIDFNTGVSAVVEVGGSGVSGGYEYKGSYRYGKTNNSSAEVAKVVRYSLSDDDGGDLFNLKVVRDPMYGTPVFRVEPTSKSSCGGIIKVKLTNGLNELYGKTNTNELEVFGDQKVNGNSTIAFHQTVEGTHTVNGFSKINTNQEVTGHSTIGANQTVNGVVKSGDGIVNKAFTSDGIFWGNGNHDVNINVNGSNRILLGDNGINYINGQNIFTSGNQLYLWGVPDFNGKNMQWNENTGQVGADNSSRRFKENIETLNEDWSLILKARPVSYTRKSNPSLHEIGYIAEEMDSIGLKRLVEHDGNGVIDGFDYERMILYVTEVVKIQHADIKNLQAEVAQLKAENSGLTNQNNTLKTNNRNLEKQQEDINKQLAGLLKRMQALEASSTGK
jgi:FtsZ-binding cell division protein ZapB